MNKLDPTNQHVYPCPYGCGDDVVTYWGSNDAPVHWRTGKVQCEEDEVIFDL